MLREAEHAVIIKEYSHYGATGNRKCAEKHRTGRQRRHQHGNTVSAWTAPPTQAHQGMPDVPREAFMPVATLVTAPPSNPAP